MDKRILASIIGCFFLFGFMIGAVAPMNNNHPLPEMIKGYATQEEWNGAMAEQNRIQEEFYLSTTDLEAAKYPLRNLFYGNAGMDYLESINHKTFGKGHFCINDKGQFLPIFCYEKIKKCIKLGQGNKTEVIDELNICGGG